MKRELIEQLTKIVQFAVKRELVSFKQEILTEIRKNTSNPSNGKKDPLVEIQKKFRTQYQSPPKPNRRLHSDPVLNEMLNSVQPLTEDESVYSEELADMVNLPTDNTGRPIQVANNKATDAVLNAMNRDYSGMFESKTMEKINLKQKFLSIVEEEPGNNDYSFEEDEDLTWLNGVK